ncbi:MAG: hypothetical protein U1F65_01720 [Verrucomicrobiota bacterium]
MRTLFSLGLTVGLLLSLQTSSFGEQHRATRLGNPATRFAPTLYTPDDLRARFRDEKLKPDFAEVLRQWGWKGNLADLFAAAATNTITEWSIPIGTTMPFMSSREDGRAICLRNVLWAGKEPAPAYAFFFNSNGRRYRCITPKACSNFFVEDLGEIPRPGLALECSAPANGLIGRRAEICLTVHNTGNVAQPQTVVMLPIPAGTAFVSATGGGTATNGLVTWMIENLATNASEHVCATFNLRQLGSIPFASTAAGPTAKAQSACATTVAGLPAILLETADLQDPIPVNGEVTYVIKVTNQGSSPATQVRLVCTLPASEQFISATGTTTASSHERTVTMEPVAVLAPKAVAQWQVVVKALSADDARFRAEVSSEQFEQPIPKDEATQLY